MRYEIHLKLTSLPAAADRRPVDPPPVVELRIFELGPNQEAKDITFHYNANFFLFATLELARPIAHGRVQTPSATATPVLTGMPVSGMAYLDRPAEAGYFLFPDLSVRHEGLYRLSFNLYEETKEPADHDEDMPLPGDKGSNSFDWRMELKSVAFSVYSAKKFPGLSESTTLSRTVAEQGCRVRIRRDVRMRRRDGKPSSADYKMEDEYGHRRRGRTPDRPTHDYRQRSTSAASDHSMIRRPSMSEQYQPAPPPPPGYGPSTGGHHLAFGNATSRGPQSYAQPPPMSPVTGYPSSTHPSPYQQPQAQPYAYSRPTSQAYSAVKSEYNERRHSNSSHTGPQYHLNSLPSTEGKIEAEPMTERRLSQSQPRTALPPISPRNQDPSGGASRLPSLSHLINPHTPFSTPTNSNLKGLPPSSLDGPIDVDDRGPATEPYATVPTGAKRQRYDEEPPYPQRLRNGERPSADDAPTMYRTRTRTYPDLIRFQDSSGNMREFRDNSYIESI